MITRAQVKAVTNLQPSYNYDVREKQITLSEEEFNILATAALKARYIHINKKADTDPLYECGMDYLEEVEL